jgi:LPS export ABC transporter protein LptC
MYDVRAPITDNGVRRGELVADSMYVFNNQTKFHFFNGVIDFNTPTGAPNGRMRGQRGVYDMQTQRLEGWGSVVVTSVTGDSMRSPHLVYEQRIDRITSDTTFVLVSRGRGQRLSGKGLETNSKLAPYKCLGLCGWTGAVEIPK